MGQESGQNALINPKENVPIASEERSASLVMPNGDPRDRLNCLTLTLMKIFQNFSSETVGIFRGQRLRHPG